MTITVTNSMSHETKVSSSMLLYINNVIKSGNLPQRTVLKQGSLSYKINNSSHRSITQLFISHPIICIKKKLIYVHFA